MQYPLFYNSVKVDGVDDRTYDADSFSDWLRKFFTTGVFNGELQVSAVSGMGISVSAGYVNINGKVMLFETTPLTVGTADGTYYRIDSVVIERNDTDRQFYIKVVQGNTGTEDSVQGVTPVRSGTVYQLVIARIMVRPGATAITQADITDTRADSNLCGIVASTVTQMDFSQFKAQFDAYFENFKSGKQTDFNAWFANLQYVLDGDVAGHLQNEIDEKLNKSGGAISGGLLTINTPAGNDAAVLVRSDNTSGELMASRSGKFGAYDTEHGKWLINSDADGYLHAGITPKLINSEKQTAAVVGTDHSYIPFMDIGDFNVILVRFTVHEQRQMCVFVRGVNIDYMLTDYPPAGKFRGALSVDWPGRSIDIKCIEAGTKDNRLDLVYFDYVYGIL